MAFVRFFRSFALFLISCQVITTVALVAFLPTPSASDLRAGDGAPVAIEG